MRDYTNWTDADEIALLRGRVAENSSLQARIVELQRALDRTSVALTAERALADDLADDIREYLDAEFGYDDKTADNFPPGHEPLVRAMARYREARQPVAIDDANVRDQRETP